MEVSMTWEKLRKIIDDVKEKFGEYLVREVYVEGKIAKIVVKKESIVEVARYLRDTHRFDHVKGVTGVDLSRLREGGGPYIEVLYHLGSLEDQELDDVILNVSVILDIENPTVSSLYSIWPSVEFHEREVYDMLGVIFNDHPKLERILLPEHWMDIPPLRKEYKVPGRE
jgi:NADH-quinone oxidoreductase subunit C